MMVTQLLKRLRASRLPLLPLLVLALSGFARAGDDAATDFRVASPNGRIVATLSSEADHLHPADHVKQSLAIVQRLQAARAP